MAKENKIKTADAQKEFDYRAKHRERLRAKYINNGISSFSQCEILELLLFYAIPRKDTKPLAHSLLEKFGSLTDVLEASESQLVEAGATPAVVFFLKLFNDVEGYLTKKKEHREVFNDFDDLGRYMCSVLKDSRTEQIFAVMLDSKDRFVCECYLGQGSFERAVVDMRKLIETCICKGAAKVAIAHNHPGGKMEASTFDYMATRSVEDALNNIDVKLVEHYIVSDRNYIGIKQMEKVYKSKFDSSFNELEED